MSSAVAGSLVVVGAVVLFFNVAIIAVGWANKRRQPKPDDRPYLVKSHGPSTYATLACFMALFTVAVFANAFD